MGGGFAGVFVCEDVFDHENDPGGEHRKGGAFGGCRWRSWCVRWYGISKASEMAASSRGRSLDWLLLILGAAKVMDAPY